MMLLVFISKALLAGNHKDLVSEHQQIVRDLRAILNDPTRSKSEREVALSLFRQQQESQFRRFATNQPLQKRSAGEAVDWDRKRLAIQRLGFPEDQVELHLARIDMLEAMHELRRLADVNLSGISIEILNQDPLGSVSSEMIKAQRVVVAEKRARFVALQKEMRPQVKRSTATHQVNPEVLAQARQSLQEALQDGSEKDRRAAIKKYQEMANLLRMNR